MTKLVFGFGSLINDASLRATAPNAKDVRTCYVKGFRRDFSVWANTPTISPNNAYLPFCALDMQATDDPNAKTNGVCFTVSDREFQLLVKRECEYKLINAVAYELETDEPLGTCVVFSACKNDGDFDFLSAGQKQYLDVCCQGAKLYGEDFYQMFLDTTFIGNERLSDLPEVIKSLED